MFILGGERAARDFQLLTDKNIRAVVNCTDDLRFFNSDYFMTTI